MSDPNQMRVMIAPSKRAEPRAPTSESSSSRSGWTQEHRLAMSLRLEKIGLEEIEVGVEAHGPPDAPVVVVLGGISAHRHLSPTPTNPGDGWWPGIVGPGLPVDTRRFRVIGMDFVGGPGTKGPDGLITTADQARLLIAVLERLDAGPASLVGASYGGMVALAAAALYPEKISRLVVACAAHRPHPMATALRSLQRAIVEQAGGADGSGSTASAVVLARALAMTTYRSVSEFESRFRFAPDWYAGEPVFPVEEYLLARGRSFARRFDATSFLQLSKSIDIHSVDPELIEVPTSLLSVDTDSVIPGFLADELAALAPGVTSHVRINSDFGHDAFLKETEVLGRFITSGLQHSAPVNKPHQSAEEVEGGT